MDISQFWPNVGVASKVWWHEREAQVKDYDWGRVMLWSEFICWSGNSVFLSFHRLRSWPPFMMFATIQQTSWHLHQNLLPLILHTMPLWPILHTSYNCRNIHSQSSTTCRKLSGCQGSLLCWTTIMWLLYKPFMRDCVSFRKMARLHLCMPASRERLTLWNCFCQKELTYQLWIK